MTAEIGLFLLILALLTAGLQAAALFYRNFSSLLLPAAWLQSLCITLALAVLITLRLDSDFTVVNVAQHSNLNLPTLYKIVGAWGNHEGSMLLWVWVLAAFGLALAMSGKEPLAVSVQSLLVAGFLLFILFTSNPFARQFPPPVDGEALNPLLQDVALAIHPPLLYLGYVGFSIVFSLAVAALLSGRMGREWAQLAHPWILAAWSALTLGIGLGSWWAYRVLGWGGFWFWDPVENVSLLPWLSGTALLHSNIALKKRGVLSQWVLLLAIVTFAMSLIGTFLVRSGVLSSVHSFASDSGRGLFILAYITLTVGGALALFAMRAPGASEKIQPQSREGLIVLNNIFLLTACATVLLGTIYPMIAQWLGDSVTVGPPYFNATVLPLLAMPLLAAALAAYVPWKEGSLKQALHNAQAPMLAALAMLLVVMALVKTQLVLGALGLGLATWLFAGSLRWLKQRMWPVLLGHVGAAVLVAGITGASLWKSEAERWMKPGESLAIGGITLRYEGSEHIQEPHYFGQRGKITLQDGGVLLPEYRTYAIQDSKVSIAAIRMSPLTDVYAVIGDTVKGRTAVRAYINPMIRWVWGGCALMALGGLAALWQQRRKI